MTEVIKFDKQKNITTKQFVDDFLKSTTWGNIQILQKELTSLTNVLGAKYDAFIKENSKERKVSFGGKKNKGRKNKTRKMVGGADCALTETKCISDLTCDADCDMRIDGHKYTCGTQGVTNGICVLSPSSSAANTSAANTSAANTIAANTIAAAATPVNLTNDQMAEIMNSYEAKRARAFVYLMLTMVMLYIVMSGCSLETALEHFKAIFTLIPWLKNTNTYRQMFACTSEQKYGPGRRQRVANAACGKSYRRDLQSERNWNAIWGGAGGTIGGILGGLGGGLAAGSTTANPYAAYVGAVAGASSGSSSGASAGYAIGGLGNEADLIQDSCNLAADNILATEQEIHNCDARAGGYYSIGGMVIGLYILNLNTGLISYFTRTTGERFRNAYEHAIYQLIRLENKVLGVQTPGEQPAMQLLMEQNYNENVKTVEITQKETKKIKKNMIKLWDELEAKKSERLKIHHKMMEDNALKNIDSRKKIAAKQKAKIYKQTEVLLGLAGQVSPAVNKMIEKQTELKKEKEEKEKKKQQIKKQKKKQLKKVGGQKKNQETKNQ